MKQHVSGAVNGVLSALVKFAVVFAVGIAVGWFCQPSILLRVVVVGQVVEAQPSNWELEARK